MGWIIDAHCHLDDVAYDEKRMDILAALAKHQVTAVINPGEDEAASARAVALAKTSPRVFACVGTHPHHAKFYSDEVEKRYRSFFDESGVVAVGEIGLDYHYDFSERHVQRRVFERQLALAQDADLPVVVHSREAAEDTVAILKNFGNKVKVLLHSFSEPVDVWEKLAPYGYYLSLGGMVTFKNAVRPKELAAHVPANRLLIETDGPYLAPVPHRGETNLPWYAHDSLAAIAQLRGEELDFLEAQVFQNTLDFYGMVRESKSNDETVAIVSGRVTPRKEVPSSEAVGSGSKVSFTSPKSDFLHREA